MKHKSAGTTWGVLLWPLLICRNYDANLTKHRGSVTGKIKEEEVATEAIFLLKQQGAVL